ncbi:translation initiation factor IF-2-like [Dipodomys spectabilis]|uniref:translation initiation factor IF-2-like n=1 Tax=Dipodomys spectabilis TaxID=105255 RepID=UPI001C54291B|nr:translation initiation factor IF-2-like [Dipodomys spectabilis]
MFLLAVAQAVCRHCRSEARAPGGCRPAPGAPRPADNRVSIRSPAAKSPWPPGTPRGAAGAAGPRLCPEPAELGTGETLRNPGRGARGAGLRCPPPGPARIPADTACGARAGLPFTPARSPDPRGTRAAAAADEARCAVRARAPRPSAGPLPRPHFPTLPPRGAGFAPGPAPRAPRPASPRTPKAPGSALRRRRHAAWDPGAPAHPPRRSESGARAGGGEVCGRRGRRGSPGAAPKPAGARAARAGGAGTPGRYEDAGAWPPPLPAAASARCLRRRRLCPLPPPPPALCRRTVATEEKERKPRAAGAESGSELARLRLGAESPRSAGRARYPEDAQSWRALPPASRVPARSGPALGTGAGRGGGGLEEATCEILTCKMHEKRKALCSGSPGETICREQEQMCARGWGVSALTKPGSTPTTSTAPTAFTAPTASTVSTGLPRIRPDILSKGQMWGQNTGFSL